MPDREVVFGAAVDAAEEFGVVFALDAELVAAGCSDHEGEVFGGGDVAFGDLALGLAEDGEDAG